MAEQILVAIVSVIALGIGAQWLAWRIRIPSILLLLIFGFVAGPVTGLLPPESLQGDWLFAFVSLSIGIILFEGGLSLRISELREVGKAVGNLITIGVLITGILGSITAYFVLEFTVGLSILIGAILTVTGPTVVIPLLRHVRPTGRVGAIARWEGITIDPIGAVLAVLVLESILVLNEASTAIGEVSGVWNAATHAMEALLLTIAISVGVSVIGAGFLIVILRRRLVPDYLQSSVALMVVVVTFAISNVLQEESGLMEVTLMGIIMANQKYAPLRRITEFKEDLQVLLIACLFILLSARLELSALSYFDYRAFLFLGILILVIRPIAVFLSSIGSRLSWKEKTFIAWLAPRGIVAAAVASLFSIRLEEIYGAAVDSLVPIVFFVIVGTVTVYGLTLSPLARSLGLADPNPQGLLILGAYAWVQHAAKALQNLGVPVLLLDVNPKNIEQAKENGLPAQTGDALSESVIDELNLSGIGRFLALTANDEVNSLAALHFTEVFDQQEVYQLASQPESQRTGGGELPEHLRGRPLFGESTTHASLSERFNRGGDIRSFSLAHEGSYKEIQEQFDGDIILLFIVRGTTLLVHAEEDQITPQAGDSVVLMLPPFSKERDLGDAGLFEELVGRACVIDLPSPASYEAIALQASEIFAQRLPVSAELLVSGLMESMRHGGGPIAPGVVLPHFRVPRIESSELILIRCESGVEAEFHANTENELIQAFLFLVSPDHRPSQHLRTLAHIAARVGDSSFLEGWRNAEEPENLRVVLLNPKTFVAAPAE